MSLPASRIESTAFQDKQEFLSVNESSPFGISSQMKKPRTAIDLARGDRIAHVRKLLEMSQERFGELHGVSRGAVGNWELGGDISRENLTMISDRTGADFVWLAKGDGVKPASRSDLGRARVPSGFEFPEQKVRRRQRVSTEGAYSAEHSSGIPDISVHAGAGPGGYSQVVDSPTEIMISGDAVRGEFILPDYVLRQLTSVRADKVHAVEVRGDSMEATLKSGDRVFIDTTDHAIGQGGLFVFADRDTDEVLVKRLRRVGTGKSARILVVSDNPKEGPAQEMRTDRVFIIGRAIARLTRL